MSHKVISTGPADGKPITLVHGLFTGAGFWLPYLDRLKAYRTHIVSIDYEKFFEISDPADAVEKLSGNIPSNSIVIGHSVGCAFARYAFPQNAQIHLCPVVQDTFFSWGFVDEIRKRTGICNEQAIKHISDAQTFISTIPLNVVRSDFTIIPRNDIFFRYSRSDSFFDGDHFDISPAIGLLEQAVSRC